MVTTRTLHEGMVVDATVFKMYDWGMLIRLQNGLKAVVMKEECADHEVASARELYTEGDKVRAVITKVDLSNHKTEASLKPSRLPQETAVEAEEVKDMEEAMEEESDEAMEEESEESEESEEEEAPAAGFGWDDFAPAAEAKKPVAAAKPAKAKKLSEQAVASMEQSLAKADTLPESETDFERLLVANPTSSHLWLRYASWLLSTTEVAKARAVIRRALKSIPVHMEEERANLWLALMNLESEYGDEEALEAVFREAKQAMEPKQAYLHLAKLYELKKNTAQGFNCWKQLAKEYPEDVEVWLGFAEFYFKQGQLKESGDVLKRALGSLKKNEKTQMLSGYAVLLYAYDFADQGRTVFEDLVDKLPKRLDLWNMYVDQETKKKNYDYVRGLFKRMTGLKMNVNKVKGVFKKWLTFEDAHGSEKTVAEVEGLVQEYINKLTAE